jgi:hypothetical protein
MPAEKFYQPNEITECPSCGSGVRDPKYPNCWHCGDCGFAVCEYYKPEVDEIRARRANTKECARQQPTTAAVQNAAGRCGS